MDSEGLCAFYGRLFYIINAEYENGKERSVWIEKTGHKPTFNYITLDHVVKMFLYNIQKHYMSVRSTIRALMVVTEAIYE